MYGHVNDGEPFRVFTRRETGGGPGLVIRFECKEGMGVLGIRKSGRTDPAPAVAAEEEDIDPVSLRAGRFVHVLASGQRQSYALSRVSAEVAQRLPTDRWVELKPHTEYGFRYLVAPDADLDGTVATIQVQVPPPESPRPPPPPDPVLGSGGGVGGIRPREPSMPIREPTVPVREASVPVREPTAPISDALFRGMTREQAIEQLKGELMRGQVLQQRLMDLEEALKRSRTRERDLIELLAKWQTG